MSLRPDEIVARLLRFVAIKSLSRDEGAMADAVQAELHAAGIATRRHGHNVIAEIGDRERPRLLLNSHLDTVPPAAGWSADPWAPRREGDRIIALGANDAKGCVTAMLSATIALKRRLEAGQPLGGTVVLALTVEEEITGGGLSEVIGPIQPIDAGLVGEPTDLQPMTAQRGLLILRCVARGRTSHPANTPADTPNNAIQVAASDIAALRGFDWGPAHPLLGRAHGHVTKIAGGVALNVIPDECEFFIDIRTTPMESHDEMIARVQAALRSEVLVRSKRLVAMSTDDTQPIVQAAIRALPGTTPGGSPAMSDMVFLAGTPAVKIGPGHSPRSHTPDEYICVDELLAGALAYERIALEYFAPFA